MYWEWTCFLVSFRNFPLLSGFFLGRKGQDRRATYGDDYAFLFLFPSTCLCWNLLLLNVGFLSFSPVYLFLAVVLLILWFVIRPPPLPVLLKSIAMRLGRLPQKGDGAELSLEILMVALSMKEALKISASSAFIAEASLLLREACLFSKALNIRKVLVESDDALAYFT